MDENKRDDIETSEAELEVNEDIVSQEYEADISETAAEETGAEEVSDTNELETELETTAIFGVVSSNLNVISIGFLSLPLSVKVLEALTTSSAFIE